MINAKKTLKMSKSLLYQNPVSALPNQSKLHQVYRKRWREHLARDAGPPPFYLQLPSNIAGILPQKGLVLLG